MARTDNAPTGRIELLYGCMFGGKTEELLRRLKSYPPSQVQAFKHARDTRYGLEDIVSHAGTHFPAVLIRSSGELLQQREPDAQIIALDEGHFFDDALPDACRQLRAEGRRVIVTALQPNSWGVAFPMIDRLIAIADRAELVFAQCARCGREADRTQRTAPVIDGQIVGGPEAFEPRCRNCWRPPESRSVDEPSVGIG